jgi:hypothetical protein
MSFLKHGYQEPTGKQYELLTEGDYRFVVAECNGIEETDNGMEKLSLVLSVNGQKVWDFRYEGEGRKGPFDMISPFLKSIGERPTPAQAANPKYWASLVGKKGMVHITCQIQEQGKYAGKLGNRVGYYIYPQDIRNTKTATTTPDKPQQFTESEVERSQQAIAKTLGIDPDDDLKMEPSDIPF